MGASSERMVVGDRRRLETRPADQVRGWGGDLRAAKRLTARSLALPPATVFCQSPIPEGRNMTGSACSDCTAKGGHSRESAQRYAVRGAIGPSRPIPWDGTRHPVGDRAFVLGYYVGWRRLEGGILAEMALLHPGVADEAVVGAPARCKTPDHIICHLSEPTLR